MSDSYSKQARTYCDRYGITLEDTSSVFQYEITLTAPDGCVLWGSEAETYTMRQARQKGSRKDWFWYQVWAETSTGTIDKTVVDKWNPHTVWNVPPKS